MIPRELRKKFDELEKAKQKAEGEFREAKGEIIDFCLRNKLWHCLELRSTWKRSVE